MTHREALLRRVAARKLQRATGKVGPPIRFRTVSMTSGELVDLMGKYRLQPKTLGRLIGAREYTIRDYMNGTQVIPSARAWRIREEIYKFVNYITVLE
jgi:hypothetical protein